MGFALTQHPRVWAKRSGSPWTLGFIVVSLAGIYLGMNYTH